MDFLLLYASISEQILRDYQWLVGILFTAGLSLLVYFKILRINNFLTYSQKYQENLNAFAFLEKVQFKGEDLYYKDSGKEIGDEESLNVVILFNIISEVGLLYRKGLIDRSLTYRHFGNVVYTLYTKHRGMVNHIQSHTKTDNISFLFKAFKRKGEHGDKIWKMKRLLFGKNKNNDRYPHKSTKV